MNVITGQHSPKIVRFNSEEMPSAREVAATLELASNASTHGGDVIEQAYNISLRAFALYEQVFAIMPRALAERDVTIQRLYTSSLELQAHVRQEDLSALPTDLMHLTRIVNDISVQMFHISESARSLPLIQKADQLFSEANELSRAMEDLSGQIQEMTGSSVVDYGIRQHAAPVAGSMHTAAKKASRSCCSFF